MTLVRWDPFRELEDMSERLNRVFSRPTLRNTGKENLTVADWMPCGGPASGATASRRSPTPDAKAEPCGPPYEG